MFKLKRISSTKMSGLRVIWPDIPMRVSSVWPSVTSNNSSDECEQSRERPRAGTRMTMASVIYQVRTVWTNRSGNCRRNVVSCHKRHWQQ